MGHHGRLSGFAARNWHIAPPYVVCVVVALWFVTYGDFTLFQRTPIGWLETVYDSMAERLLHGRLDVSPESIQGEAFVKDGRTYAYFPPAPAVPRILLNRIYPAAEGRWSRLILAFIYSISVAAVLAIYCEARLILDCGAVTSRWIEVLLVFTAGLGSTVLILMSRASVYHEAALWAACFNLLTVVSVLRFWRTAATGALAWAAAFAAISFFSRATGGLGAVLLIAVTGFSVLAPEAIARRLRGRSEVQPRTAVGVLALASVAAIVACFLFYNWARFGSPFEAVPLRYTLAYSKQRLDHVNGTLMNVRAIPGNVYAYWLAPNIPFQPVFPWVGISTAAVHETESVKYSLTEPTMSILASSPALLLLAIVGVIFAFHLAARVDGRPLLLLAALAAGSSSLLAMTVISERYKHDFFPFLVTASCFGLAAVTKMGRARNALLGTIVVLTAYGIFVFSAVGIVSQRDGRSGVPEQRRIELRQVTEAISGTGALR